MGQFQLDLASEELSRIVGFAGYGRADAPVWFIGLEEGLGDMTSEEAVKNLKVRADFKTIMDLRSAHHLRLWERGSLIDWDRRPPATQVWTYMAKIMRAHHNEKDCCSNLDAAKNYVKTRLGRSSAQIGETFLTELSPIPAAHGRDKRWMQFFKSNDPHFEINLKRRNDALKAMMKANPQALFICYGSREQEFAEFLGVQWDLVSPKVCRARGQRHLLLPFFGNGQISHDVITSLVVQGLLKT